jgi:hypothetical protein
MKLDATNVILGIKTDLHQVLKFIYRPEWLLSGTRSCTLVLVNQIK